MEKYYDKVTVELSDSEDEDEEVEKRQVTIIKSK